MLYLEGFIKRLSEEKIEKVSKDFNLEKIRIEKVFNYFNQLHFLRLKFDDNLEDLVFSSFPSVIIDKINKIKEVKNNALNFEIIFSEEEPRNEALEFLKSNFKVVNFEIGRLLSSFSSIYFETEEPILFFSLFRKKITEIEKDLKIFTNISESDKLGP